MISELLASGRLAGTIQGRQEKAVFVPDIYSQTQNAWIDGFFKQNGYIGKYIIHCIWLKSKIKITI